MSYAIPVDELSISKMEAFRRATKEAMLERAKLKLGVRNMEELIFRELLPATDLGQGATGYTNETYLTGAIAAITWTSVYDTAVVPQLWNDRVIGFYKIAYEEVNPLITLVRFREGNTGATTKAVFNIEPFVYVKLTPEVYLSEPVVYDPNSWVFIECYARAAIGAAGHHLAFGCFVAEPAGGNVS